MIEWTVFFPMLTMGLLSSTHCVGMCGGVMGALTMAVPASARERRWGILVGYNLGRIGSYSIMGFAAGLFAQQLAGLGGISILRILAGLLVISMGLYLADWWRGLTYLEKLGRYLWVYLQPLSKNFMPVDTLAKALALGALWGWLPCGLVYSALALAMTQPEPWVAGGSMLAFGIGTLPAVVASGVASQQLVKILRRKQIRIGLALILIIYGVWTLYFAVGVHSSHHASLKLGNPQHNHHRMMHDNVDANENVMQIAPSLSSSSATSSSGHHHSQ